MRIPRLSTRQLMVFVAIAALISFFMTETWRRRRYEHCMVLAAVHARDQAFSLAQAKKWRYAVGLARETAKNSEIAIDQTTGHVLEADERISRLKTLQYFYELQAAYHGRERRVLQLAAERPWEPLPASSYYPDLKRLYQQAAQMK
jgi:hypothetical protein